MLFFFFTLMLRAWYLFCFSSCFRGLYLTTGKCSLQHFRCPHRTGRLFSLSLCECRLCFPLDRGLPLAESRVTKPQPMGDAVSLHLQETASGTAHCEPLSFFQQTGASGKIAGYFFDGLLLNFPFFVIIFLFVHSLTALFSWYITGIWYCSDSHHMGFLSWELESHRSSESLLWQQASC